MSGSNGNGNGVSRQVAVDSRGRHHAISTEDAVSSNGNGNGNGKHNGNGSGDGNGNGAIASRSISLQILANGATEPAGRQDYPKTHRGAQRSSTSPSRRTSSMRVSIRVSVAS